jgi:type I restriction enzyme M protein
VPFTEIEGNEWDLSINRYKQIEYEEVQFAHPKDILQEIEQLDQERIDALTALKELLG